MGALAGFLICAVLFLWITWPLGQYFDAGKVSSHRPEIGPPRQVIAGDHLQLMYHFELLEGFLTGETPWFHNLYEFNTGDDTATRFVDFYYLPFSLIYALFSMSGHSAAGWNAASFLSVLFGAWGMWRLTGCFRPPRMIQVAATLVGAALPYRWLTLLHGSPTGFAMMYVPWILYGLHRSIVGSRISGGWVAGVGLLLAGWGDIHTFFFSALMVPPWCMFCFLLQETPRLRPAEIGKLAKALSGFLLMGLVVVLQVGFIRGQLSGGTMDKGRSVEEVALFSPPAEALLDPDPDHPWNRIYLTFSALAILAFGTVWLTRRFLSAPRGAKPVKSLLAFLALLLVAAGMTALSLGPSISLEWGPGFWNALCTLIPPYEMIRQPAKIFSGLTTLLGLVLVIPFAEQRFISRWPTVIAGFLSLAFLVEVSGRIDPTISLLDGGNDAYAAILDTADNHEEVPRALAIVLWPGDSHWSSLYQYYAVRHRLRLVNGYRPNVPEGYQEDIFLPFSPLNQGWADDALLDRLLGKGIRYLLLHEDAFPEQVSPFDVGQTLSRLLAHPRIRLLEQDHAVWSFEVLEQKDPTASVSTGWSGQASSSMLWPLAYDGPKPDSGLDPVVPQPDTTALRGHFARLTPDGSPLTIAPYPTFYRDGLSLYVRLRGQGNLEVQFDYSDADTVIEDEFDTREWTWHRFPFPAFTGFQDQIITQIRCVEGALELDAALMTQGEPFSGLKEGDTHFLPAPSLFHAGHTDLETSSVILTPSHVPYDEVVYGPRLPLPPGRYRATLLLKTEATEAHLGEFRLRDPQRDATDPVPVTGREPAELEFTVTQSLPVVFAFRYFRSAPLSLQGIRITRLPEEM